MAVEREMFSQTVVDEEARLVHWCRMGLLAVGILHWMVFYLLTRTGPAEVSSTITRARSLFCFYQ
jgi:hypothetical protein